MESDRHPTYTEVDGFRLPPPFTEDLFRSAVAYKATSDDVVVATFPKCGTTWMCQIVRLVLNKGVHIEITPEEYYQVFPFLECYGAETTRERLKPGCIKTHLPFDRITFSEEAKYIYVARHPRDSLVSFYHHTRYFPLYRFSDGKFDVYFDLFIKGDNDFNDFFDHLLSWYEQRHRPNILFLTYESMKTDHRGTIQKVAEFLECPLTEQQVDEVLKYSSFEFMKKETNDIFDNFSTGAVQNEMGKRLLDFASKAVEDGFLPVGKFIRKGIVGEGKLTLTEEQEEKLQKRIREKTKGSDVMSLWPTDQY